MKFYNLTTYEYKYMQYPRQGGGSNKQPASLGYRSAPTEETNQELTEYYYNQRTYITYVQ